MIRRNCPGAEVGITLNLSPHTPASISAADRAAAWQGDGIVNRWFLDPISARGYPPDIIQHHRRPMDFVQAGDLEAIAVPLDFLGVNYYSRVIAATNDGAFPSFREEAAPTDGRERTQMGWEIYPEGLYEVLQWTARRYGGPRLYVTENGAAYPDQVGPDGRVDDPQRIAYLREHLAAAARAIAAGVPLRGYFAWSLLDNFEWAHGYSKRFGLIYVDYPTQRRIPKASAHWYHRVIAANAVVD